MQQRRIREDGPAMSAIGLGCMGMSEFYGPSDEAESIRVIHHALDHGVTALDTADMYGAGRNEILVGKALQGRRDDAFLCTKFAVQRAEALDKNVALVRAVETLAKDKGCTPAQLALAWVLSRGEHVVTIPGTRKVSRLDENAAAADVELTSADIAKLDAALPKGAAIGERYANMQTVNR